MSLASGRFSKKNWFGEYAACSTWKIPESPVEVNNPSLSKD
jgi:hypothetical protein